MTLLIGTTLFYVISDNSTVIEFTPETEVVSDTLKTPSPRKDPNNATRDKTAIDSSNENQNRSNGAGQPRQGNGSADPVENREPLAVQAPKSSDSADTISGPDKERIQNEIRRLREDTNRILKQINSNN